MELKIKKTNKLLLLLTIFITINNGSCQAGIWSWVSNKWSTLSTKTKISTIALGAGSLALGALAWKYRDRLFNTDKNKNVTTLQNCAKKNNTRENIQQKKEATETLQNYAKTTNAKENIQQKKEATETLQNLARAKKPFNAYHTPEYWTKKLFEAIDNGNASLVEKAIKGGAQIDAKNEDNQTPLYCAIEKENVQIVKILLNNKANTRILCGGDNEKGMAWDAAIASQNTEIIALINNTLSPTDRMYKALLENNLKKFNKALQDGANPKKGSSLGEIPSLLLDSAVNLEQEVNEKTYPIHVAAAWAGEEIIAKLLQNSPKSIEKTDANGNTPLLIASSFHNLEATKTLIKMGANKKATNKDGCNALEIVLINNREESLEENLENPLILTTNLKPQRERVFAYLLKHGVPLNKIPEDQDYHSEEVTALITAYGYYYKLLKNDGVDELKINMSILSALDYAKRKLEKDDLEEVKNMESIDPLKIEDFLILYRFLEKKLTKDNLEELKSISCTMAACSYIEALTKDEKGELEELKGPDSLVDAYHYIEKKLKKNNLGKLKIMSDDELHKILTLQKPIMKEFYSPYKKIFIKNKCILALKKLLLDGNASLTDKDNSRIKQWTDNKALKLLYAFVRHGKPSEEEEKELFKLLKESENTTLMKQWFNVLGNRKINSDKLIKKAPSKYLYSPKELYIKIANKRCFKKQKKTKDLSYFRENIEKACEATTLETLPKNHITSLAGFGKNTITPDCKIIFQ